MRKIVLLSFVASLIPWLQAAAQSTPAQPAQAAANPGARIAGCYNLYYTNGRVEQLVGMVAFDTTTVTQGEARGILRFLGGGTGFLTPRGSWTWLKPDSVSIRVVTGRDSGIQFAFPK